MTMTNEELATAIDKAHEHLRKWCKDDSAAILWQNHLKELLEIQRKRCQQENQYDNIMRI